MVAVSSFSIKEQVNHFGVFGTEEDNRMKEFTSDRVLALGFAVGDHHVDSSRLGWATEDGRIWSLLIKQIDGTAVDSSKTRIGRSRKPVRVLKAAQLSDPKRKTDSGDDEHKKTVWITAANDGAVRRIDGDGVELTRLIYSSMDMVFAMDVRDAGSGIRVALGDKRFLVTRELEGLSPQKTPQSTTSGVDRPAEILSAAFVPDGTFLLQGGMNGRLTLLKRVAADDMEVVTTGSQQLESEDIWSIAIDGTPPGLLACGTNTGRIRVWDVSKRSENPLPDSPTWECLIADPETHGKTFGLTAMAIHPKTKCLVWGLKSGGLQMAPLKANQKMPKPVTLLPPSKKSKDFRRYGLQFDEEPGDDVAVYSMAFNEAGTALVTGDRSGRILLWDWTKDSTLANPTWVGMQDNVGVFSLSFYEDFVSGEQLIISGGDDAMVRIWRVPTEKYFSADPEIDIWDSSQIRPFKAPLAQFSLNQFPAGLAADDRNSRHQVGLSSVPGEKVVGVLISPVYKSGNSRPVVDLLAISSEGGQLHRLTSTPLDPRMKALEKSNRRSVFR